MVVSEDGPASDLGITKINNNVLIEIGAAFVLYDQKVVLLWDKSLKVPSNLQVFIVVNRRKSAVLCCRNETRESDQISGSRRMVGYAVSILRAGEQAAKMHGSVRYSRNAPRWRQET